MRAKITMSVSYVAATTRTCEVPNKVEPFFLDSIDNNCYWLNLQNKLSRAPWGFPYNRKLKWPAPFGCRSFFFFLLTFFQFSFFRLILHTWQTSNRWRFLSDCRSSQTPQTVLHHTFIHLDTFLRSAHVRPVSSFSFFSPFFSVHSPCGDRSLSLRLLPLLNWIFSLSFLIRLNSLPARSNRLSFALPGLFVDSNEKAIT